MGWIWNYQWLTYWLLSHLKRHYILLLDAVSVSLIVSYFKDSDRIYRACELVYGGCNNMCHNVFHDMWLVTCHSCGLWVTSCDMSQSGKARFMRSPSHSIDPWPSSVYLSFDLNDIVHSYCHHCFGLSIIAPVFPLRRKHFCGNAHITTDYWVNAILTYTFTALSCERQTKILPRKSTI